MNKGKIPVNISVLKTRDGKEQYSPAIPLSEVVSKATRRSLSQDLKSFADKYETLIQACQEILKAVAIEKKFVGKVSSLLFWVLGDLIIDYVNSNAKSDFFLNGLYTHLSRELRLSESSLKKILSFRRRLPRAQVDANKSWEFYRSYGKEYHRKRQKVARTPRSRNHKK